ncbi:hypothetical protein Tsubulata_008349, partial [Turnera subulata]
MIDYYKLLGLERGASKEEIKAAFRLQALDSHPDKHSNSPKPVRDSATHRFDLISEAYGVLGDDLKRAGYNDSIDNNRPCTCTTTSHSSPSDDDPIPDTTYEEYYRTLYRYYKAKNKSTSKKKNSSSHGAAVESSTKNPSSSTAAAESSTTHSQLNAALRSSYGRSIPLRWIFATGFVAGFVVGSLLSDHQATDAREAYKSQ